MEQVLKKVPLLLVVLFTLFIIVPKNNVFAEEENVEVIVVYKDEVHEEGQVSKLVKSYDDVEVLKELPMAIMTVPKSEIKKLENNPNVETVAMNEEIQLIEPTASIWDEINESALNENDLDNLKKVNAYAAWTKGLTGKGVKIAVIDGGVERHKDLKIAGGKSFFNGVSYYDDDDGHGTHVAGIIAAQRDGKGTAGIAPDASVYSLKVFHLVKKDEEDEGELIGTTAELIKALDWAIANKINIVNMSLGLYGDNKGLRTAIQEAGKQGILLVAASGNKGIRRVAYPAAYEEVIAVSSVDGEDDLSYFSNFGEEIELVAPGESINSTVNNNKYGEMSGTSMATPHVTGLLAILKQKFPNYSPAALRRYITDSALDLGDPGRDEEYGYGLARYLEPTPLKIAASDVKITNNFGTKDVITLNNLQVGRVYTIYKDSKLANQIIRFTAENTTESIDVQQLGTKSGSIYITEKQAELGESSPRKVSYKAERLPAISAKSVKITNYYKSNDKIVFKELTKGYTYTIYSDAELNSKLTSFTATGTTKTVSIKQIGSKAGALYIVVSKTGYEPSKKTKVTFGNEKIVALSAKNVTITNNKKSDKIAFKGLTKGFIYTVYSDKALKNKVTSFKATGTTKSVKVKQIGAKAGSLYIVASKSGLISSSATKVNFKGEPTTAISAKKVKVSNKKKEDTITIKGLKKGVKVVIYKDSKKKKKLTSFKATSSSKVVKVKQLGKNGGKIYITAQMPGYSVSSTTTVSFSKEK